MIYRVQKRLIRICGGSVVLVFLLIFLGCCIVSVSYLNEAMDSLVDNIWKNGGSLLTQAPGAEDGNKIGPRTFFGENTRFNIRFFSAHFDSEGSSVNIQNDPEITEAEALEYSMEIRGKQKKSGWEGGYRYKVYETQSGTDIVLVEGSMNCSVTRMLLLSVGIVLVVAALLIVFLIIILSKRAVRPIAESYEKQKQFVTDANHELKTPLTLIMTNLDIVEAESGRSEWIDDIRSEGERMNELVNQLVILTRMDEDVSNNVCEWFNLSIAVEEAVSEFQVLADEKGMTVRQEIESGIDYYGDEASVRRLIGILLDNAVKYCDPEGEITVLLGGKRSPCIRVENTYIQVDELELGRLFDRFYRSDKARTFNGGFGIGLSIAKAIVQNHHGDICAYRKDEKHIGFRAVLK